MCLSADLAKAAGGEVTEILGQRDPDAQRESDCASPTGVPLGLRHQAASDTVAAEGGVHGEPADVKVLASPGRQHAPDEAAPGFGHDHGVIGEGRGNGPGGLAQRARLRFELAAVFLEGCADEFGDGRAFRGDRAPDRDLARFGAQTPVCSGKWSSATKLVNFVVLPSKRSITLSMGPCRCLATMISALP